MLILLEHRGLELRNASDELNVYFTLFRATSFLGKPCKALLEVVSTSARILWLSIEVLNWIDLSYYSVSVSEALTGKNVFMSECCIFA